MLSVSYPKMLLNTVSMVKNFAKLVKIPVHPPNSTGYSPPSLLKGHLKRVNAILLSGTSSSPEMSSITLKSNILITRYIFFQFLPGSILFATKQQFHPQSSRNLFQRPLNSKHLCENTLLAPSGVTGCFPILTISSLPPVTFCRATCISG